VDPKHTVKNRHCSLVYCCTLQTHFPRRHRIPCAFCIEQQGICVHGNMLLAFPKGLKNIPYIDMNDLLWESYSFSPSSLMEILYNCYF
jgi:hypothetical protein